jgi:hypothetical protein
MQRTRAIPFAWLSSGLCPNRPKGWIPLIIIIIIIIIIMFYNLYHSGITKVCKHFCDLSPCRSWLTHELNSSFWLLETRQQCNDFVLQPTLTASDESFQLPAKCTCFNWYQWISWCKCNTRNYWQKATSPLSLEHPWPFFGKYHVRMSALICRGFPQAPQKVLR